MTLANVMLLNATLNPEPQTAPGYWTLSLANPQPTWEGQGDLASIFIAPLSHMIGVVIPS